MYNLWEADPLDYFLSKVQVVQASNSLHFFPPGGGAREREASADRQVEGPGEEGRPSGESQAEGGDPASHGGHQAGWSTTDATWSDLRKETNTTWYHLLSHLLQNELIVCVRNIHNHDLTCLTTSWNFLGFSYAQNLLSLWKDSKA